MIETDANQNVEGESHPKRGQLIPALSASVVSEGVQVN